MSPTHRHHRHPTTPHHGGGDNRYQIKLWNISFTKMRMHEILDLYFIYSTCLDSIKYNSDVYWRECMTMYVGLRKWFCKKIPRWVVSLKETDKFNFSIFPPDRWSWRGVDKKVNIPSADVPSICIITLEKIPFVYWNGHSTSQTVHHRPFYCASYIFTTYLKL